MRYLIAIAALAVLASASVLAGGGDRAAGDGLPESVPELIEHLARSDFAGMAASRKLTQMGRQAVPALVQATRHDVPRVRYWSIAVLSGIGDERAVPAVTACLEDPHGLVREVAVWHLGRWWHREDVRASVIGALRDGSPKVRGRAIQLITSKEYVEAVGAIEKLLEAEEPEVRYDALHALASLRGADVLPLLRRVLQEDESALVRECAVRCCTVVDPRTPETGDVLIWALRDGSDEVRRVAVKMLRRGFGQHFGFDPTAEPLEREDAVRQWRAWYEEHKKKLEWNARTRRFEIAKAQPPPGTPEAQTEGVGPHD